MHARPGELFRKIDGGAVECSACAHRCKIRKGASGICRVRFNDNGELLVPYGYASGVMLDPVEKKPFFHVLPGSNTLSFGMLGCNFHCDFCQNWLTSQILKDAAAHGHISPMTADELVSACMEHGAPMITSTYNEPLITSEWAADIFRRAREQGIKCAFVSNGYATPEVIEYLRPLVNAFKVDLKSMDPDVYRKTVGGDLTRVLEAITSLHHAGFWIEIVTLLVPGMNDSPAEIRRIAAFVSRISRDIPWHITAFRPQYRWKGTQTTSPEVLLAACKAGAEAGLNFVYSGNLPGMTGEWESTRCPSCRETLIERSGFSLIANRLKDGACPKCGLKIPGLWG